jgi:hypothetical protein
MSYDHRDGGQGRLKAKENNQGKRSQPKQQKA